MSDNKNNTNKILLTIKEMLGQDDTAFNTELLAYINASIFTLSQLGVISNKLVVTEDSIWTDLMLEDNETELAKNYIFTRTKILFDPPLSSFVLDVFKKQIEEYEWRLKTASEVI